MIRIVSTLGYMQDEQEDECPWCAKVKCLCQDVCQDCGSAECLCQEIETDEVFPWDLE